MNKSPIHPSKIDGPASIILFGAGVIANKHNHPAPVAAYMDYKTGACTVFRRGAESVRATLKIVDPDKGKFEVRVGDNKTTVRL
jgi:hypothetical protein